MLVRALVTLAVGVTLAVPGRPHPAPAGAAAGPPPATAQEGGRRSLEELLAEARAEREKAQAALLPRVTAAVTALDELERRARQDRAQRLVDELVGLGLDAAPLLVQFIDPGEQASRAQVFRSERVAEALRRLQAVSVTDDLLRRARSGSLVGRLNALEVLGGSPEPARVAPALEALARETADDPANPYRPVRLAALRALARLGGEAARAILVETLQQGDLSAADGALEALVDVRLAAAAPHVVALAATQRGSALAGRIAAYFAAVPAALEVEDAVVAVVQLCARDNVSREAKLALLDVLRRNDCKAPSAVRRELQGLRDALDQGVRRATLVFLARAKDRSAKRDLFEPLDAQIKADKHSMSAYEARAELQYLVGDHSAAIRDWREAMKLASDRNGVRSSTPYIGIARSLALTGKFKEAKEYLDQAPISLSALHALAADPDFAELRASRYGDVFRLPGEDGERR